MARYKMEGVGIDEVGRRMDNGEVVIKIDKNYFRPSEVETLLGDASKAREKLGWEPKINLKQLISEMVINDDNEARILYNHNTTSMSLYTAGSEALKIDGAGIVTKPLQPSALAGVPSEKLNLTGDGTNVVIGASGAEVTEIYDKNGDMSNGVFTCPVDGRYLMTLNLFIDEIDDGVTDVFIQMESSNRTQYWARDPHEGGRASSDSYGLIIACIVEGDANDTLTFKFSCSGTDKSVDMTDLTTIAVELLG